MTLYQEVIKKGIPYNTWYSDLRIPVTKETMEIVTRHGKRPSIYHDQTTNKPWYDLAFQNEKYWEDKLKLNRN